MSWRKVKLSWKTVREAILCKLSTCILITMTSYFAHVFNLYNSFGLICRGNTVFQQKFCGMIITLLHRTESKASSCSVSCCFATKRYIHGTSNSLSSSSDFMCHSHSMPQKVPNFPGQLSGYMNNNVFSFLHS